MQLLFAFLFLLMNTAEKKTDVSIKISPLLNGSPVVLNQFFVDEKDSIMISTIRWYVSDVTLYHEDEVAYKDNGYYLVDLSDKESLSIAIPYQQPKTITSVSYRIGIDSVVNSSGVMGGALDPMKGMYWTWQSGYINFKLEGELKTASTKKDFTIHLGGYRHPYPTDFTVRQKTTGNIVKCKPDFSELIHFFKENKSFNVMSPGQGASQMSLVLKNCFIHP